MTRRTMSRLRYTANLLLGVLLLFLTACSEDAPKATKTPRKSHKKVSKAWLGKWKRNDRMNDADLEITKIRGDSIAFELFASSGGNNGEFEAWAKIDGKTGRFVSRDRDDGCLLEFSLIGDSMVEIDQKNGMCFAGLGVSYSGDYKNAKLITHEERSETLYDLGILSTVKEDSKFKSLVGDHYQLFVNTTQLTSEDKDLDSLGAKVQSSGVRGLFTFMENIIMKDSAGHFWAAVIDDQDVCYFTNSEQYKNKLPKTIENWRQRFNDYMVNYNYKP